MPPSVAEMKMRIVKLALALFPLMVMGFAVLSQ
jgi:hypothetical protein